LPLSFSTFVLALLFPFLLFYVLILRLLPSLLDHFPPLHTSFPFSSPSLFRFLLSQVDEVWGTKKDKEEKKRKKEEQASYDPRAARDIRKQDKKKDDVEVEGQGLLLFEEEEVNDEQKPQFAGHVVAVLERAPGQLFSGTLGVLRPSSAATQQKQDAERREREGVDLRGGGGGGGQQGGGQGGSNGHHQAPPKIIWFRPTDKRVPLIAIRTSSFLPSLSTLLSLTFLSALSLVATEQAPADFVDRSDAYQDLFVACIKRWPITSLHPFGQLVEELGAIGDIEVETNALLKDCNFSNEDFGESVQKCLPPTPWWIPERESTLPSSLSSSSRRFHEGRS
jgi:protein SSD1